jgi:serine/threonine protein kinase
MAPEQARGEIDQIDERTDIYALGAILHYLLTGQEPGQRRPRQLNATVPRAVEAVCLKAMAVDKKDRYASVQDLAADVARYLAGQRVQAYPERWFDTARRWVVNYQTAIVLVLAYLIMRVILLFWAKT